MRKLIVSLMATTLLGLVAIVGTSNPASAAPCVIPASWTNPNTGRAFNAVVKTWNPVWSGNVLTWHNRQGCYLVAVEGTATQYRFRIWTMDTIDNCPTLPGNCTDAGATQIQWRTPCNGCTNPWTTKIGDQDSAQWFFNDLGGNAVWVSQWFNAVTHGGAGAFSFRMYAWSHHDPSIVSPWVDTITTWPAFTVTY